MNRTELQQLARERLLDAKALLARKRWAGAYYLAGYAAECGLKACVLVRLAGEVEIVFADRRFSEKCWTHNLVQLVDLAGLKAVLDADMKADPELVDNWDIAQVWTEASRYNRTGKSEAEELYESIADKKHGMLTWIKKYW